MPARKARQRRALSTLVWLLNGSGAVLLLAILVIYFARQPARASGPQFVYSGGTPRPTSTAAPTAFYLPTITPNPLATAIEDYSTPTPFVFAGGPAAHIIGYSVEGVPIEYYAFGQGERQFLIVAGIHGGYEGNTIDLANQMVVRLSEDPALVPADATLFIITNMNPDGAARGRNVDARTNANGVDLNRNFPSRNWVADWDHSNCWNYRPTTGGQSGGSEPETRAVMNFIGSRRILGLISYHSAALGVFPGGDPWEPASERLASALANATRYPYPPIDIGCHYTGTLADWAVERGVVAAVDMELSNHRDAEISRNMRALEALLDFQG